MEKKTFTLVIRIFKYVVTALLAYLEGSDHILSNFLGVM